MATVVPIPRHPADVTAGWLSTVLTADVRSVEVTPIGTGQTGATYRVSATYATDDGLPGSFAIKLPAQDDAVRERVALAFAASTDRGDEMILTMLHRGCRAIRELGTLDLVSSYQSI